MYLILWSFIFLSFQLFGTKYASCRGAKVHVNPDGTPKRSGIIKFSNQTDQQLAIVEMNKYEFKGRELRLRLGPTKQRGPRNLLTTIQNPMFQQGAYGQQPTFMPGMFPPGQFPMNPMVCLPFLGIYNIITFLVSNCFTVRIRRFISLTRP